MIFCSKKPSSSYKKKVVMKEGPTPLSSPSIQKWRIPTPCTEIALLALGYCSHWQHRLRDVLGPPHLKSKMGRPAQYRNPSSGARGRNCRICLLRSGYTFTLQQKEF